MDLSTPNTTGADTLVINLSQDAWQGDARFTVAVDGQHVGGDYAATTAHGAGSDTLALHGDFVGGQHTLTVTFTNDAFGGTADTDRNLYVDGVTLDGKAVDGSAQTLLGDGSVDIAFGGGGQAGNASNGNTSNGSTGNDPTGVPGNWTTIWDESFDNGSGLFSNHWGPGTDESVPGQITVWTSADDQDSGMMTQPPGYGTPAGGWGYGLYSFTFKTEGTIGTYALTWPASNVWPGPELDVMEINGSGQPYSTIHWKGDDGSNQYTSYTMADIDPKQVHTYAMDWEQGRITMYVDGKQEWTTTDHVPNDYAHGGENEAPGIGTQTWWNGGAEAGHNYLTLYDASYKVLA